jgi:1-acyl-sn-glycerol-3-phosphate acyltransferase
MRRFFESLRSLLIWIATLPVFTVCCLAILFDAVVLRRAGLDRVVKATCRIVLFCCGIRLRLSGAENVVPGRQYIIMMNHVNFFDPFVFYARYPGLARGIEEESHFRWPVYGWAIRGIGQIPISRTNIARALESLARAAALIKANPRYSIVVLPEGTRTLDGKLRAFKRGGFHLAVEAGLDILPIVQIGAGKINRKGSRLIRPGRIDVVIEPAIPVAGHTKDNVTDLADRVRAVFLARLGE